MPDYPVLNCAAGVCCHPGSPQQLASTVKALCAHGCPNEFAGTLAKNLLEGGVVLFPATLAKAIGDFAHDRKD